MRFGPAGGDAVGKIFAELRLQRQHGRRAGSAAGSSTESSSSAMATIGDIGRDFARRQRDVGVDGVFAIGEHEARRAARMFS